MQKHSSCVSCLHGKNPNIMKINSLERAKMLLLHRRVCGAGYPSTTAGQAVRKQYPSGWSVEGLLQWDQSSASTVIQKNWLHTGVRHSTDCDRNVVRRGEGTEPRRQRTKEEKLFM